MQVPHHIHPFMQFHYQITTLRHHHRTRHHQLRNDISGHLLSVAEESFGQTTVDRTLELGQPHLSPLHQPSIRQKNENSSTQTWFPVSAPSSQFPRFRDSGRSRFFGSADHANHCFRRASSSKDSADPFIGEKVKRLERDRFSNRRVDQNNPVSMAVEFGGLTAFSGPLLLGRLVTLIRGVGAILQLSPIAIPSLELIFPRWEWTSEHGGSGRATICASCC